MMNLKIIPRNPTSVIYLIFIVIILTNLYLFNKDKIFENSENKDLGTVLPKNEDIKGNIKDYKTDNFKNTVLNQHNFYRKIAGIVELKWNYKIEANAQKWADYLTKEKKCAILQHSSNNFRTNISGFNYIGENIYFIGTSNINDDDLGKNVVDTFYSEIKNFQYSKRGWEKCPKRGNDATGHFTQVMWDKTTDLGCAYSKCENGIMVVCQYGPGGNYLGKPPFSRNAAKMLNEHPINQQYGGLPVCD